MIPVGAVSKGLKGLEAADYDALAAAGVRMLSDDGMPVDDPNLLLHAMHRAANLWAWRFRCTKKIATWPVAALSTPVSTADTIGRSGVPPAAESDRVRRDLTLAAGAGKKVHIAHLSTRESLSWSSPRASVEPS